MKISSLLCLATLISMSLNGMAADLRAYNIKNCEFWNTASDGHGFNCTSWPSTIKVAEAESFAKEIRALEKKIAELEQKLNNLPPACRN